MKILAVVCLACVGSSYCHAWGGSPQDNDWKVARVVVGWLPGRTVGDASYIFRAKDQSFFGTHIGTDRSVGIGFVQRDDGQQADVRLHVDVGMDFDVLRTSGGLILGRELFRMSAGIFVNRASNNQFELGIRSTLSYLPKFAKKRASVGLYGEYSTGSSGASKGSKGGIGVQVGATFW